MERMRNPGARRRDGGGGGKGRNRFDFGGETKLPVAVGCGYNILTQHVSDTLAEEW